jgi:4-amino-4-deoxy-L-arabinose transferase-like glycosyltransferase
MSRRWQVLILGLLAGGFLFLYIGTLAPDILPADNGEFQLVAAELGVAHPPGFALYTMLAHLMTRLPLNASPAYKVNLFSALTGTATLLLVYLSVYRLAGRPLPGIIAALALGTATTFWAQATTANIRSLTAFLAAAAIYVLLGMVKEDDFRSAVLPGNSHRKGRKGHEEKKDGWVSWFLFKDDNRGRGFYLLLFVIIFSFGITHHASLIFMGLVFGLFIVVVNNKILLVPRRWPVLLMAGLSGLLPWLYLVWRGAAGARGAPATT